MGLFHESALKLQKLESRKNKKKVGNVKLSKGLQPKSFLKSPTNFAGFRFFPGISVVIFKNGAFIQIFSPTFFLFKFNPLTFQYGDSKFPVNVFPNTDLAGDFSDASN